MSQPYTIGLDVGQRVDYSAISIIQPYQPDETHGAKQRLYRLGHLERMRELPYYAVVDRVKVLLSTLPLYRNSMLVVDATGVGIAVCDMLTKAGVSYMGVTITGGEQENKLGRHYSVPKVKLMTALQVLFENEQLKIHKALKDGEILRRELQNVQIKELPSGRETFSHREGEHDDLVLATALATWGALKFGGGVSEVSSMSGPYQHKGELPFQASERPFERTREFSW